MTISSWTRSTLIKCGDLGHIFYVGYLQYGGWPEFDLALHIKMIVSFFRHATDIYLHLPPFSHS